jgi:flagellar motility protein MotE (MotC chaperone)
MKIGPRETPLPRRPGARPLVFVMGLLLASAALRTGLAWQEAVAATAEPVHQPPPETAVADCATDPDIARLLDEIAARAAQLDRRDARIADRMAALQVIEDDVTADLAAIEAAESRLDAALATASTAADEDLGRLVAMYERMDPADAGRLFQAMAPDFASGFLSRMRPETAAAILAVLPSESAYAISVIIAGRNAGVTR